MITNSRTYKYFNLITVCFVTIILLSNLVASIKVTQIYIPFVNIPVSFTAGLMFFPVSYLVGDILTEVYGYAKSRQVIWSGFGALLFANLFAFIIVKLPPDPNWHLQEAYESIFGMSFRISLASMLAFFCGEFCNSFVIAKLKLYTQGRYQALRIISSTAAGELVDTLIFYPLAFLGNTNFPIQLIITIMFTNYLVKVLWEVFMYPLTQKIILFLKKEENEDYFDQGTNFSPFHI